MSQVKANKTPMYFKGSDGIDLETLVGFGHIELSKLCH